MLTRLVCDAASTWTLTQTLPLVVALNLVVTLTLIKGNPNLTLTNRTVRNAHDKRRKSLGNHRSESKVALPYPNDNSSYCTRVT